MKAILMSDRPKWVAKILNGYKTIEIRKTAPKCEFPIDVYIHCTNGGLPLEYIEGHGFSLSIYNPQSYKPKDLRGKVVAKFTLRKIEKLEDAVDIYLDGDGDCELQTESLPPWELYKKSGLTRRELEDYVGEGKAYAWHISDLVIFDKPKELSEFGVKRPPQSWFWIKEGE